jgi:hypothetical protein
MRPAIVLPYHDPDGLQFPHLQAVLPDLKGHFEHAYLCPSASTMRRADLVQRLRSDPFFTIFPFEADLPIGDHFAHLYREAARVAPPEQVLHLCFPDRLFFALETEHRASFLADVDALKPVDLPLIFHRSPAAWATHPRNYLRLEGFVTQIGETLFGKTLDHAWCHVVDGAGELGRVMAKATRSDLSLIAEMILHMQDHIHTRDVDWLAWEDPFLLGRDPDELRRERESSLAETEKRLSYVLPMVDLLTRFAMDGKK